MKCRLKSLLGIIFWLNVLQVHCFLEELQDIMSNSISYLNKGLSLVKRVEDFIDNSIGEECIYECKGGKVPKPKPNHVPTSNGCGSLDFLFDDSEDSFIYVEKDFQNCCNEHDFCYDQCGVDKDQCDLKFKKCLYNTCKAKKHEYLDGKKCRLKAKLFYVTVIGVGCQSFLDAQKESCDCVKPSKTEL